MYFLFFIFFIVFYLLLIFSIQYFKKLFSDGRQEYSRDELISFQDFILREIKDFFSQDTYSYLGVSLGLVLGILLTYLGGIIGNHYESYIFHSVLIPVGFFFLIPFVKDQFLNEFNNIPHVVMRIFEFDMPFFLGLSIGVLSKNSIVYGYFHQINFLWILLNNIAIIGLLLYKFYKDDTDKNITYEMKKAESSDSNEI